MHPRQGSAAGRPVGDQLRSAALTERQRPILDFALHVGVERGGPDDDWQAHLPAVGFDLDDLWDEGLVAAFFGLSSRPVTLVATPPNEGFLPEGQGAALSPRSGPVAAIAIFMHNQPVFLPGINSSVPAYTRTQPGSQVKPSATAGRWRDRPRFCAHIRPISR